jgi:hypothetical protein
MRFAQESVKLQFDNVHRSALDNVQGYALPVPRSRARAQEAILSASTAKHRDVDYIRAKMRRFKVPVAAWCLESKVHPGDSGDFGTAYLSGYRKSMIPMRF